MGGESVLEQFGLWILSEQIVFENRLFCYLYLYFFSFKDYLILNQLLEYDLFCRTRLLRDMFKKFDGNNSGYALKREIIQDLKDMGIYSAKMGNKIEAMDTNKDGNISYKNFLTIYFQGKWMINYF